ncbi:hypothetical protein [Synoicihabitans lomoniglobus]|uniref:Uncharacterized protein n=1 Tax=Synoicihabitans lomoniglobus TaxID=2909285 RepID=A0AAF0CNM7_9BACT|nr:hypothetical protein [Opitutaceae bacterium LMO-M01]WED64595.1 hypothetical protein PXH66_19815 [Opitutaceae bacterium LMO-M01]
MPHTDSIEQVRTGQRLVLFAILANLLTLPLALVPELAMARAAVLLVAMVVGVLGIVRMTRGLGFPLMLVVLLALLMLVPLLNLLLLVFVNARATTFLRAQGFKVGLLGAKPPPS